MTDTTTCAGSRRCGTPTDDPALGGDAAEGWHALASAELGRRLTAGELATAECLSPTEALDLLFPHLSDEARHEALWALAQP
jgi:hypothetical protein